MYDWYDDYDYYYPPSDDNLAYEQPYYPPSDDNLGYEGGYNPEYTYDYDSITEIPNNAQPGQEGYGWRYFSDGTVIAPNGTYYYRETPDSDYKVVWSPNNTSGIGSSLFKAITGAFQKPGGGTDWRKVAGLLGGAAGLTGLGSLTQAQDTGPKGYQGGIPSYSLVRERVEDTYDPNRRPGSGGRRYFSDTTYAKPETLEAARTAAQEQAAGLAALNASNPANQYITQPPAQTSPPAETQPAAARPASKVIEDIPVPSYDDISIGGPVTPEQLKAQRYNDADTEAQQRLMLEQAANDGINAALPINNPQTTTNLPMAYNQGGIAALKEGKYLRGATDGMSDELRTTIDGKQPAALSHGEFVIPADVVSHLGNGNSDAGAKKLYEMMDRIRQARTGTTKQGREINPNKFLPKAR